MEAEVFLQEKGQPGRIHAGQATVFEIQEDQRLARGALREPVGQALPKKGGFAAAPHPNHGDGHVRQSGQTDLTARQ